MRAELVENIMDRVHRSMIVETQMARVRIKAVQVFAVCCGDMWKLDGWHAMEISKFPTN